ncbi:MAG TPA: FecR domain-containing protein [Polyangia bacterium]|nr:FecR domain-containing protein [Polyangia bacterium]
MTGDDRDGGELGPRAAALAALARRSLGHLTPSEQVRGREVLRARLALRRRVIWSLSLAGIGAAAFAAVVLVPRVLHRTENAPPLAYRLEGGALAADGRIEASADVEPALRFADGTVISLARGTKGRLADVDGRGAHVAIADGTASVNVVPKPHARWRVDAGPFVINVHGTVFSAAWNESTGRLDVKLERGSVSVEGPVTGGPIAMRAGQRLTVAMHQSRVLLRAIDDHEGDVAESDTTTAAPVAEVAPPPVLATTPATTPARTPAPPSLAPEPAAAPIRTAMRQPRPTRSWPSALASGDFAFIIEDALRDLPRALDASSSDDLAALADAARYRRQDDLARRALDAQRRRFQGSPRAADAAFFLGRLDEKQGAGLVHALRWYDRYLNEAPSGSYVAEALGRKMVAVRDLYGVAQARTVADEYVRRFPHGSYAGAAQALRDQAR